jgi:O-antigen/teichoic acid export membrane protein
MGTVRNGGAILVLLALHGGIVAFFIWQLIASAIQTVVAAVALWKSLPSGKRATFRMDLLHAVWRFSLWVSASALIGACVTQADKIVLTRLLPLEQYGYYTLAGAAAGMLWAFILPVNQALYPRLARLHAVGDEAGLEAVYHRSCQAIAVILFPAAIVVALFSYELIFVWTGNHVTAQNTYVLVSILVAGTAVNGLLSMPALLQSASGWPGLMTVTNAVAALLIVPAIYTLVHYFGAAGAAMAWLLLNVISLVVTVPIMHRRLLRGQMRKWALADVAYPLVGTLALGLLARYLMRSFESRWLLVGLIGSVYVVLVVVCGLSTAHFRELAREFADIGRQAAVAP